MILIDLSLLILFLAMAKALGGKVLAAGKVDTGATGIPFYFELGAGLGLVSYAVFFLGVTVGYRAIYFQAAALLMLAAWHKEVLRALREGAASFRELAAGREGAFGTCLLILLLVCVVSNLCFNYAPPVEGDELAYHLNLPQKYLLHGRIFNIPEDSLSFLFLTLNLLYIPLMAVKSILAAKLLSAAFGIFDMALVFLLTREFAGKRYALLAAVLFYTTPMTIGLAGVGKIDAGVTFYALLTLWSFLKYSGAGLEAESNWFILFAASSGMLAASKWSGILFASALTLMLVKVLISKKKGVYAAARLLFAYGVTIMLFVSPWLIKNMLWAGNPLYPAMISPRLPYDETLWYVARYLVFKFRFSMVLNYFFATITGTGYLIAAFLPLYFVVKNKNSTINALLVFSGLFILILCVSGYALDLARYTYCCYAIYAIAGAYAIVTLSDDYPQLRRIIAGLVLAMLLAPNACMSVYFGAKRLPYILGIQSADQYLQKQYEFEGWDVVKWVRKNVPPASRICYLGATWPPAYYYDQPVISASRPSVLRYSLGEARTYLKNNGFDYVILCRNSYTEADGILYHSMLPFMSVYWFKGTSIDQEFALVYSSNGTRVYRIAAK